MKSPVRVGRPRSPDGGIKHPPDLRQGSYLDYGAKDLKSERIAMVCEVEKEEAMKKKNAKWRERERERERERNNGRQLNRS